MNERNKAMQSISCIERSSNLHTEELVSSALPTKPQCQLSLVSLARVSGSELVSLARVSGSELVSLARVSGSELVSLARVSSQSLRV